MSDEQQNIKLVDVIASLRANLEAAIAEGVGSKVMFGLNEIEIELQTVITAADEGSFGGKAEFSIPLTPLKLELGGDAKTAASTQNTHTIKLKLEPWVLDDKAKTYSKGLKCSD